MFKFIFFVVLTLSYAPPSFAGFQRGNGGNIVFCADEARPMFLDYYLFLRQEEKIFIPLLPPGQGSAENKALNMIEPISQSFPRLTKKIAKSIRDFKREFFLIPNMPRVVVVDEGLSSVLETYNCQIHQLIFQQEEPTIEGIRYFVSSPHWKLLDDDQKAVAILHEAILREYIGTENFYFKDPIQVVVKGLLGYALFKDELALNRAVRELSLLKKTPLF